ncbi:MAG: hypothetical protein ACM31E_04035, partial [Fibrobacterota bacterium]
MPHWWIKINFENTPMSWLQSTILSICAFLLLFNTLLLCQNKDDTCKKNILLNALTCCAFTLLSLDDAFQIHERIRGGLLQPNHIGSSLPFISDGDIVLPLYAFFGAFLAYLFLKSITANKKASLLFKLAFLASLCAVAIDTIEVVPKSDISSFRVIQFTEEILELCAQSLFLASFADLTFCKASDKNVCSH